MVWGNCYLFFLHGIFRVITLKLFLKIIENFFKTTWHMSPKSAFLRMWHMCFKVDFKRIFPFLYRGHCYLSLTMKLQWGVVEECAIICNESIENDRSWIPLNQPEELLFFFMISWVNWFIKLAIVLIFWVEQISTQCEGLLSSLWKWHNISGHFSHWPVGLRSATPYFLSCHSSAWMKKTCHLPVWRAKGPSLCEIRTSLNYISSKNGN